MQVARKILTYILNETNYLRLRWLLKYGLKYYDIWCYQLIEGWLPEIEALALYDISRNLPDNHPIVVEIGSWLGKSSVVLAKGIKRKNSPYLYCIDPFNASGDDLSVTIFTKIHLKKERPLKDIFVDNIKAYGVSDYIKILEGYSYNFAKDWDQPIVFLFIDGDHSYDAVLQDYLSWSKFIRPGGYIAFHDVELEPRKDGSYYWEGPGKVVREYILNNDEWVEKRLINSLFIARKK